MKTKQFKPLRMLIIITFLLVGAGITPGIVSAEEGDPIVISISAEADIIQCGKVNFTVSWVNGSPPFDFTINYGDGDSEVFLDVSGNTVTLDPHIYLFQGTYVWTIQVSESVEEGEEGLSSTVSGNLTFEGPAVTLDSEPFPPIIVVGEGDGTVVFTAFASGGTGDYQYSWDLDGDGVDDGVAGEKASFAYTEVGKSQAQVMVTDDCGFTATATLPVVVSDPEDACHPTAQKIADGVNSIFPDQADDLYTCEDIYGIFDGSLTGSQTGFGRMWHAYRLAETMEELTWEEIRDWHLDTGGWGALLQLDRFSELLEDHSIVDLMALVMSEDYSLGDVRVAVRSATRHEADLDDALNRIAEGAKPGELSQFYQLAQDLEADPATLDGYLADGFTLSELKHTANFADRMEVDWTEIAEARAYADSWGDIKQAYQMATDGISPTEILITGIQEYKQDLRDVAKEEREETQTVQQEEKNKQTGEKLAEQFSAEFGDVMNLLNGECEGNWGCVRKALREQAATQSGELTDHDNQTALQIATKYGFSEQEVVDYYENFCSEDWACTRAYFRDQYMSTKETGKPTKETGKPDK